MSHQTSLVWIKCASQAQEAGIPENRTPVEKTENCCAYEQILQNMRRHVNSLHHIIAQGFHLLIICMVLRKEALYRYWGGRRRVSDSGGEDEAESNFSSGAGWGAYRDRKRLSREGYTQAFPQCGNPQQVVDRRSYPRDGRHYHHKSRNRSAETHFRSHGSSVDEGGDDKGTCFRGFDERRLGRFSVDGERIKEPSKESTKGSKREG